MNILPEYGFSISITDVNEPVIPQRCWFYDASLNDFVLRPITMLEETTGTTVTAEINGYTFDIPAAWNMLVADEDLKLVDTVPITQCSSGSYHAFLMHPDLSFYKLAPIILKDLSVRGQAVHVTVPRAHAMLHPVGPIEGDQRSRGLPFSCLIAPQDLGKWVVGKTAMEVLI